MKNKTPLKKNTIVLTQYTEQEVQEIDFDMQNNQTYKLHVKKKQEAEIYFEFNKDKVNSKNGMIWISSFAENNKRYKLQIVDATSDKIIYAQKPRGVFIASLSFQNSEKLRVIFKPIVKENIKIVAAFECLKCMKDSLIATNKKLKQNFDKVIEINKLQATVEFLSDKNKTYNKVHLKRQKKWQENLSYISILEIFCIVATTLIQTSIIGKLLKTKNLV